jgi:hypothetical protein
VVDDRKRRIGGHDFARPKSVPGVPVEIDPELTPLPAAPSGPEAFAVLPLSAQVRELREIATDHAAAFERVWDARHVVDELAELKASHKQLATVVAQDTQQVTDLIRKFDHWGRMSKEAWDKSNALSDKQIERDAELKVFFTKQFPEYLEEVKASNALLRSVNARVDDVEHRVEVVEAKQLEHALAIANLDKVVDELVLAARDEQVASTAVVNERRRWISYVTKGRAVLVAIVAAVTAAITYLSQHL